MIPPTPSTSHATRRVHEEFMKPQLTSQKPLTTISGTVGQGHDERRPSAGPDLLRATRIRVSLCN